MASSVHLVAIATIASLLIVAPLPSDGSPTQTAQPHASERAIANQLPSLTILPLLRVEPQLVFEQTLQPVAVADEPPTPEARDSASEPKTALAAVEGVPAARGPLSQPVLEEFPGAVPVMVPRLGANAKWRRVLEAPPGCTPTASGDFCSESPWARWNELAQRISGLAGEERLQAANEAINGLLVYSSDQEVYGVSDYWATLEESLSRGRGDCEDIAIAKMWLLNAAGVSLSSMRLVVLKDTLRNLDHAVLSVVEDGHQYVLDNVTTKVGRADWMRGYRPIYALSSEQSWIYGMRVPVAPPLQVAQNAP